MDYIWKIRKLNNNDELVKSGQVHYHGIYLLVCQNQPREFMPPIAEKIMKEKEWDPKKATVWFVSSGRSKGSNLVGAGIEKSFRLAQKAAENMAKQLHVSGHTVITAKKEKTDHWTEKCRRLEGSINFHVTRSRTNLGKKHKQQ